MSDIKITPEIQQYFEFMAKKFRIIFLHNDLDELDGLLFEEVQRIFEFGALTQRSACGAALGKYCVELEHSGEDFSMPMALAVVNSARVGEKH